MLNETDVILTDNLKMIMKDGILYQKSVIRGIK